MEILTLNILPNGFTITNPSNKEIYSQYSSYNDLTWNSDTIESVANETYNNYLNQTKLEVINDLAALRYNYQVTPIAVLDGTFSPTESNIAKLDSIISVFENDKDNLAHYSLVWKSSPTVWFQMDIKTAKALKTSAAAQIQRAFNKEYEHFTKISAITTFSDLAVYDFTLGWESVASVAV